MIQPTPLHTSDLKGRSLMVTRGPTGRLFCEYEGSPCISTVSRDPLFSTASIAKWKHILETRARLLKLRGLRLYILIAPESRYICRDEIPRNMILSDQSPARQFCELFSGIDNLTIINPEAERSGRSQSSSQAGIGSGTASRPLVFAGV